jgi:hypothetical protein
VDVERAVAERLKAAAGVAALAGTRVYANAAEEKAALPRIVIEVAGRESTGTYAGLSADVSRKATLLIRCQARDKAKAVALWQAVAGTEASPVLNRYRGTITVGEESVVVEGAFEQDASDSYEQPQAGERSGVFGVDATYDVWWRQG